MRRLKTTSKGEIACMVFCTVGVVRNDSVGLNFLVEHTRRRCNVPAAEVRPVVEELIKQGYLQVKPS